MREQGESLLPLPAVKARVGMGKTKIYEEIKAGAFPACIKNGRTSVWVASEIADWIEKKILHERGAAAEKKT
ncbi:helix-turn-helix transcriptional regulator [Achromobacter marplatensis]|uniref:AlpA family phage regulatory protein n=1 Tax=Achromobacter marplatensis TaxID=470868 RepID=A0AA43B3B7_9BURK|nr:AlpA family phage regulatory protein [Achromobacter marplatensis]MDH2052564.1 AlpA family phage regulatory protein [Achromobacter marplatensis]